MFCFFDKCVTPAMFLMLSDSSSSGVCMAGWSRREFLEVTTCSISSSSSRGGRELGHIPDALKLRCAGAATTITTSSSTLSSSAISSSVTTTI